MIELIAALIGGAATVIAALIAKKDASVPGTVTPPQRPSLTRVIALFLVGGIAGALLASLVLQAAEKGLLAGGYRVPPGTVVAYMGNSAPDGWLPCNGDPVSDTHPTLKAMLVGGLTPDLRGRFPRGLDTTGIVDIDGKGTRALGSKQEDAYMHHSHSISGVFVPGGVHHYEQGGSEVTPNGSVSTSESGGTETRPKNIAMNFIIKY